MAWSAAIAAMGTAAADWVKDSVKKEANNQAREAVRANSSMIGDGLAMGFDGVISIAIYGTVALTTTIVWYGPKIPQLILGAMNPLGNVPGLGQLMSNTTSGAAGQVDVSQIDMTAARVGMSANGFPITSDYGPRSAPTAGASSWHTGVDVGAPTGTPLYAPAAGKVRCNGAADAKYSSFTNNTGGYGPYGLEFESADPDVPDFFAGHNSACTPGTVSPGQKIGAVGNEGVSTGPHLHLVQFDANGEHTEPAIGWVSLWMGATVPIIKGSGSAGGKATGQISEAGVDFIKAYESFHPNPYWDYAQWTWGYGTKAPGASGTISREQADAELRDHIQNRYLPGVVGTTPVENLTQCELDALVSFNFNTGAYASSDLARAINSGNKSAAANEFDRWVHAGGSRLQGLVNRRADEKEMFLSCDYERDR